jgi:hypothetical protein
MAATADSSSRDRFDAERARFSAEAAISFWPAIIARSVSASVMAGVVGLHPPHLRT